MPWQTLQKKIVVGRRICFPEAVDLRLLNRISQVCLIMLFPVLSVSEKSILHWIRLAEIFIGVMIWNTIPLRGSACTPKDKGGLGIRPSDWFNQAALAKLDWKILVDPFTWWVK